ILNQPLVAPVAEQERLEGQLRYHHVAVREGAEAIAFFSGDEHERAVADKQLEAVIANSHRLVWRRILPKLNEFVNIVAAAALPYSFLLYQVLNSEECLSSDTAIMTVRMSMELLVGVTWVIGLGPSIATAVGLTRRVGSIGTELGFMGDRETESETETETERERERDGDYFVTADAHEAEASDDTELGWHGVSLATPGGREILTGVTASVPKGQSMVIMGPSGIGKSSLLRCLAGLWPVSSGHVSLPADTLFVPQTPYLTHTSLWGEVTYPATPTAEREHVDEDPLGDTYVDAHGVEGGPSTYGDTEREEERERVLEALRVCQLDYLLERFDLTDAAAWGEILSGGEKQRLGLARLLFHSPSFAVMDESTAALPVDLEESILSECVSRGITMVSVAHRRTVIPFHQLVLVLSDRYTHRVESSELYLQHNPIYTPPSSEIVARKVYPEPLPPKAATDTRPPAVPPPSPIKSLGRYLHGAFGHALSAPSVYCILSLIITAVLPKVTLNCQYWISNIIGDVTCQAGEAVPDTTKSTSDTISLLIALGMVCIVSMLCDITAYTTNNFSRERLTKNLHKKYFAERNYYRVATTVQGIDAPDQRISADARVAGNSLFGSIVPSVQGIVLMTKGLWFTVINCLIISYSFFNTEGADWRLQVVPWVFLGLFVLIQVIATRSIPAITNKLQEAEGAMRYTHSRSREFCESIAFYKGEEEAGSFADAALGPLIDRQISLARHAARASWFNHFTAEFGCTVLPLMIVSWLFPSIDPSEFSLLEQEVNNMMHSLTGLLMLAPQVAAFFGTLNRVSQLDEQLEVMPPLETSCIDSDRVAVQELDVVSPAKETLVRDLSFRVGSGLWDHKRGTIERPTVVGNEGVFFVPQHTYVVHGGSLRGQICYPLPEADVVSTPAYVFKSVLHVCQLDYLLESYTLESREPWAEMLSGGEKQRLGLARLLFHSP
ncbi:hypothetical protein KIPB_004621, partial [Kipferlia bialata]